MRTGLALLLAAAVANGAGCGAARSSERSDDDAPPRRARGSDREPFAAAEDFKPVAFHVEVKGHGRPIVLIPGLGCPGEVWDDVVAHLGDDYESHVLTLSG